MRISRGGGRKGEDMNEAKRMIPKLRWVNYHKEFPQTEDGACWKRGFGFDKYWGGLIWTFSFRHYALILDFRRNWLADMIDPSRIGE
jgi:hypothetical protein